MKQNLLALNRSSVMYPLLREAIGMALVYYQSHLVPSTVTLPTATQTTVKKDRFHSQDQELETCLVKRGLNVEHCGLHRSNLLCCCYCVLGRALCCGLSDNLLWFDTVEICALLVLWPGHSGKMGKKRSYKLQMRWICMLVIMITDCSKA